MSEKASKKSPKTPKTAATGTRKVTILGAGKIGFAMAVLLQAAGGYELRMADQSKAALKAVAALGVETLHIGKGGDLSAAMQGQFAVLNALPFHMAIEVAGLAAKLGVHYFDLTEDVQATHAIRKLASKANSVLMPQCGLAPGFIGIVGNDLAQRFDQLEDLKMRVGALPRYPQGTLRYNLTWSTEGLINEYINPCEALVDGEALTVHALEGLETFALDGIEYEAFNTSGGLGTLTETWAGKARNVDYKSIRYPGHCAILKLLLNELKLRDQRELLHQIFDSAIPATRQDVIVVFASATGRKNGRLMQESYSARIVGTTVAGHALTAIQLTTAAGICCALDLVAGKALPQAGFIGQENISFSDFLANRFGQYYRAQDLNAALAA
ncbi:saccharopine dehydrogenase family protein [Comamonas sp. J-3]|uniref:saccharopine dehydrogenase family protein n=1 Tax=Comamonas trifloxystrobinivorans TaxID=3350256 RepID=UPI00372AD9B5